ncbi:ROK family protein [Streptomyces sp. NPDC008092]|uniref:ROK family protein n=1 Tax=Streptomyces sp. NPDC008092 TaxID=3364808 RepID=UPI0036E72B4D
MRTHNLCLVVDDVRRHRRTTRSEISERTGLARASLTAIIPELVSAGLLKEVGSASGPRGGRPVAALEFDGSRVAVVALEITVGEVIVESVDLGGRTLRIDRAPHGRPIGDPAAVIDTAVDLLLQHLNELDRLSVAFGLGVVVMPAPLAGDPPVVVASSDLGWGRVDLLGQLVARVPRLEGACLLVNDANVAAIAEAAALEVEVGHPLTDLVYLKSLTGIGGGAIVAGNLVTGARGIGFEPGHVLVRAGGKPCTCARHGCFNAEAGPEAVLEDAGLADLAGRAGVTIAMAELVDRARSGDPRTLAALGRAGEVIETVITDLSLAFDPQAVVLGGYWADVFNHLRVSTDLGLGEPSARTIAWTNSDESMPFVLPGRLGARAARAGAFRLAIDRLLSEPTALNNFNG